jgi:hypothetical protein
MLAAGVLGYLLALHTAPTPDVVAGAATYYVSPAGDDASSGLTPETPFGTIQRAIDLAGPGDEIVLAAGEYFQDVVSRRDGAAHAPIRLSGPKAAVLRGGGAARIVQIHHDHITLEGFTIDGLWGPSSLPSGYRNKLVYAVGAAPGDGVTGLRLLRMTFQNAGGECVRLRYFAQHNEVAASTFRNCGVYDFRFDGGGKNGEALYIGTAPEQRGDGRSPTSDPDRSDNNWIHHNVFDTQGGECVDIKEAASGNIVEHNTCTGQRDADSAGVSVRGNANIVRHNESYGNQGAGIRVGGDTAGDGTHNSVYANHLHHNQGGGIKLQRRPQSRVCGNMLANNAGTDVTGEQRQEFAPEAPCG